MLFFSDEVASSFTKTQPKLWEKTQIREAQFKPKC